MNIDDDERACRAEQRPEILIMLSGGIDSAASVDFYRSLNRRLCALHVDYGQASEVQERQAAQEVAAFYRVPLFFRRLDSARPKVAGEIPGRNAFLVLTAVIESPPTVRAVVLGIHAGTVYKDCSAAFVDGMNNLLRLHGYAVEVLAPFLEWHKAEILRYCAKRQVPIGLTYSCERGGDIACGECLSCLDRRSVRAGA